MKVKKCLFWGLFYRILILLDVFESKFMTLLNLWLCNSSKSFREYNLYTYLICSCTYASLLIIIIIIIYIPIKKRLGKEFEPVGWSHSLDISKTTVVWFFYITFVEQLRLGKEFDPGRWPICPLCNLPIKILCNMGDVFEYWCLGQWCLDQRASFYFYFLFL